MEIKWIGASSSNYTEGRTQPIRKIILHWIVGTLESADGTFQDGRRRASAHYGIGDDDIHQYVKDEDTAWHAGNWDVNCESIGIEHEGGWLLDDGTSRFKPTEKTHQTSAMLVRELCDKYNIPLDREHILKHNEVSDSPTACPGLLDVDRIISLAKNEAVELKDRVIDWYDFEGKQHTVSWYVYEWGIEKRNCLTQIDINNKLKEINESLQKTNATISSNLTQLEKRVSDITEDNNRIREENIALKGQVDDLTEINSTLLREIGEINEKLNDIAKMSVWEFIKLKFNRG